MREIPLELIFREGTPVVKKPTPLKLVISKGEDVEFILNCSQQTGTVRPIAGHTFQLGLSWDKAGAAPLPGMPRLGEIRSADDGVAFAILNDGDIVDVKAGTILFLNVYVHDGARDWQPMLQAKVEIVGSAAMPGGEPTSAGPGLPIVGYITVDTADDLPEEPTDGALAVVLDVPYLAVASNGEWSGAPSSGGGRFEDCFYFLGNLNAEPTLAVETTILNAAPAGTYVFALPNGTQNGQRKRFINYTLAADVILRVAFASGIVTSVDITAGLQSFEVEWSSTVWVLTSVVGATLNLIEE